MRTTIEDFKNCLDLIDERLERYDVVKEKAWLTQNAMHHTSHVITHIALAEVGLEELSGESEEAFQQICEEVTKNLTAAALRSLMALHRFLEEMNELSKLSK